MSEKKAPELRFAGFTDAWEQRKLGELADIVGGGTPSTSNSEYWDGDIDWYAPAEIADQIFVSSSERKITQQGYDNSSAKMLPVGTVLFTSRAGIGKTAILRKEGCTNQGFQSIVPHINELDSYFIFSRSEEMKRYGETVGAGSTFVEVSGKQMANMELMMPTTMEEQVTIGSFFSNLDSLITLHQRELHKLQIFKKSMLEKMFPRNGESVPQLRFHGFTDAWEQRKLGEALSFLKDGTHGTHQDSDVGVYLLSAKNIKNGEIVIDKTTDRKISEEEFEVIHSTFKLQKNDVLLTIVGSIGEVAILQTPDIMTFQRSVAFLRPKEWLIPSFLKTEIESDIFQKELSDRKSQSAQPGIYLGELEKIPFVFPVIEEQQVISSYFRNLDRLITLHQRELTKLLTLKKSLLQKMLV